MSDKNQDAKVADKAGDVAKNIWLAGLGAYGKAFDEAHVRYEKVSKETTRLFDELVIKGKKFEDDTQDKLSEAKEKSSTSIEDRIAKVRKNLGFGDKSPSSLDEISHKVDELSAKLDLLIESIDEQGKPKKPAARAKSTTSAEKASV